MILYQDLSRYIQSYSSLLQIIHSLLEKIIIAKKYILPKIREQVNFKEGDIIIPDDTIQYLVTNTKFTQNEEGVRNLKRCLEIIHTKLNCFHILQTLRLNSKNWRASKSKVW